MALDDLIGQLRKTAPAGMMNPATLDAIQSTLARILDWRKRRALAGVSMSADALARHQVEMVPELPRLDDEDYAGVLLLASPMGSGKTQRIGRPFADWAKHQDARFVATCHRQSLVAELAHRLACDHYQDTPIEQAWAVQAFATCLPSLVKDAHAQVIDEAGFVFVDEIAQVLRSVAAKVTVADKKTRADVFHALRDLVSRAHCIIGADAGMDDRVLSFLESCRPGERFRVIQQPHQPAGMTVQFGYGHDALATAYGEAMARLSQGERLWIGCGEKSRAIEAARVLADNTTGKRILLLHGDNRENAAQAEFWRDPEAVSRTYDCVIHTGVISSGMSIEHRDGPHFTHGMMLASGATITPADALQMLRRVRYLKTWTVAATPNNARDMDNADAILAGMEQSADLEGLTLKGCTDFDGFVAGIEADNARHRADFAAGLWWALESQCFDVQRLTTVFDADMAATLKAVRAEIRQEQCTAILAAPDMTADEAKRLSERTVRTEAEQVALLRHRIKTDMGLDDLTDDDLDDWNDGRGPQQMDRFSAASKGLADRTDHTGENLSLRRFGKARALAYDWLLDGLDLRAGLRVNEAVASSLIERVIERRYLLAFVGIVPAKWARDTGTDKDGNAKPFPMPAYPVREVGEILERMGLELKRRRNNIKAKLGATYPDISLGVITPSGTQSRKIVETDTWHELTGESWARMEALSERRNKRRATVGVRPADEFFRPAHARPEPAPILPFLAGIINTAHPPPTMAWTTT
jgi:putative DNA primase/helicase